MDPKHVSLSQAIEGYFLAAHARRLSPATLADYDNAFRKFEAFLGRDPPLAAITPHQIRGFLNGLEGLAAKTVLNHHTALCALWSWAAKEGLTNQHIVRRVQPPKPEQREIIPYTRRDIKAMLAACGRSRTYIRPGKRKSDHGRPTAQRERAIILLLVDTGLRASELCNLRIGDLDLKNRRVRVMGKGRKERLLPFSPRTAQALWRYLAAREDRREHLYVFCTRTEQPINRHNLRHTLQRIGDHASVSGVTIHRFRHTFAITFLRNGGQIFALQRILGHSTLDMVKRYLAIAQTDIERAHQDASPVANWLL